MEIDNQHGWCIRPMHELHTQPRSAQTNVAYSNPFIFQSTVPSGAPTFYAVNWAASPPRATLTNTQLPNGAYPASATWIFEYPDPTQPDVVFVKAIRPSHTFQPLLAQQDTTNYLLLDQNMHTIIAPISSGTTFNGNPAFIFKNNALYSASQGTPLVWSDLKKMPAPANGVALFQNFLEPIPPNDPAYFLCQGSSTSGSQACFYNRLKSSSTVAFPSISPDVNAWIGVNSDASGSKLTLGSSNLQTVYLGEPNDAAKNNNAQISVSLDSKCSTADNLDPATCAKNPDQYCHCGPTNDVCGLSCAPGLVPYKKGSCVLDKGTGMYVQLWQCIRPVWIGTTDGKKNKICQQLISPYPPAGAPKYPSQQACMEEWADCPAGFSRKVIQGRPGCYRDQDVVLGWECDTGTMPSFKCTAHNRCGSVWNSKCEGGWQHCKGHCTDTRPVPAFGYACNAGYWTQCTNPDGCGPNSRLEQHDKFCSTNSPFA